MSLLVDILISEYSWWIIAISLTLFTIWFTISTLQVRLLGSPFLSLIVRILWTGTIIVWLIILARDIMEYLLGNITAQIIIFALWAGWLYFMPVNTTKNKKRGTKK